MYAPALLMTLALPQVDTMAPPLSTTLPLGTAPEAGPAASARLEAAYMLV